MGKTVYRTPEKSTIIVDWVTQEVTVKVHRIGTEQNTVTVDWKKQSIDVRKYIDPLQLTTTEDVPRRVPEPALSGTDASLPIVDDSAPIERPSGLTDWLPDCLREWRDDPSLRALFHPTVCQPNKTTHQFTLYKDGKVHLYCNKGWYYVPLLRREFSDIHSAAKAIDLYYATEAQQFDGGPDKTCSQY